MAKTSTFVNPLFTDTPDNESAQRIERARRAYKVAKDRKMSWQAYARMLTRNNKLRVELTGGTPCTDGETIWLRVPVELGDELPHDRKICGTRHHETKRMLCAACDIFDGIDCTQYHEVSHITAESFQSIPDGELAALLVEAIRIEAEGKPESTRAQKLVKEFDRQRPRNFVHAANIISPWLGVMLNAVEDARVNENMRQARPGTAVMFQAQTNKIFEEGIEQLDGTRTKWSEQPLNMQAVIGVYCKVSGLDYRGWLVEEVVEALDDPEIVDITLRARTARSVSTAFRQSIRFLEALRRLGYCRTEEDIEDDPQPEPEPQPNPSGEQGDDDGEGGDGESDEQQEGESGSGGGSGGSSDDMPPPSPADAGAPGQQDDTETDDDADGDDEGDGGSDDTEDDDDDADGAGKGTEGGDEASEGDDDTDEAGDDADGDGSDDSESEWDGSNPDRVETGLDEASVERLPMGEPGDAERGLAIFGRHNDDGSVETGNDPVDEEEINRAIVQADYFDAPSQNIYGVNVHEGGGEGRAWTKGNPYGGRASTDGIKIPENILSPALLRLRRAFDANRRGAFERNRKNGAIDARVLGDRVLSDDYRWFKAKKQPGKRDYFVLIGLDVSGSTSRPGVIDLIKQAAYAKAELCQRLGVKFAVYAHTGEYDTHGMNLDMYVVKGPKDRWDAAAKERLCKLQPSSANLDGHTLEFYRKVIQQVSATDRILMYYTDGAMPMENYDEELEILEREIKLLKHMGVTLVGVGIKNDDPIRHGLDTIRLDKIADVPKVVEGLEKRLNG